MYLSQVQIHSNAVCLERVAEVGTLLLIDFLFGEDVQFGQPFQKILRGADVQSEAGTLTALRVQQSKKPRRSAPDTASGEN